MKIKLVVPLFLLVATLLGISPKASAQDLNLNVCIDQFPCHLKTGKLLPGFLTGTPCNWEKICKNYRNSADFKKLKLKLQKQKRKNLKRSNPVHHRK